MLFNVLVSNVDDHLRNHGFLWLGEHGWSLSPAYDVNPTPTDVAQRILTTNINLDEGTCDMELALSVAEYFGLAPRQAQEIAREVARATSRWRDVARNLGAPRSEIDRMASAFEHGDLEKALVL